MKFDVFFFQWLTVCGDHGVMDLALRPYVLEPWPGPVLATILHLPMVERIAPQKKVVLVMMLLATLFWEIVQVGRLY